MEDKFSLSISDLFLLSLCMMTIKSVMFNTRTRKLS